MPELDGGPRVARFTLGDMRDPYPAPLDATVAELDPDDLEIRCPGCGRTLFCLGYAMQQRHPAGTRLRDLARRHVCQGCSRPGRQVRCEALIRPHHRSGAEGSNQTDSGLIEF